MFQFVFGLVVGLVIGGFVGMCAVAICKVGKGDDYED